jgi:predicted transcriptional regulator
MKNRSRLDISAAILDIAQGGALRTQIMYEAYLSLPQLREYLEALRLCGALEYVPKEKKFHTTQKGMKILSAYKEVGHLLLPKSSFPAATKGIDDDATAEKIKVSA